MRIRVWGLIAAFAVLAGSGATSASEFRGGFPGIRTSMGFHGRAGGQLRHVAVPRMGFHQPFNRPFRNAFRKSFFRPFQNAFHRPFFGVGNVPLYLDQDYGYPSVIVIQERSESPDYSASLLSAPSASGLPVVMGIREVRPDRAEIQILNEPAAARAAPRVGARVVSVPAGEPASASTPELTSGARIVHLSVPVGSR
jgi:hypothetical protein